MGFSSIGPVEIMLIFLVILLLFGAKKLPELARGLGKGIREFKNATKQVEDEFDKLEDDNDSNKKNGNKK
ncbi:MAG: twin-arginine translocase TatA/TatE family subunit [bacterium]